MGETPPTRWTGHHWPFDTSGNDNILQWLEARSIYSERLRKDIRPWPEDVSPSFTFSLLCLNNKRWNTTKQALADCLRMSGQQPKFSIVTSVRLVPAASNRSFNRKCNKALVWIYVWTANPAASRPAVIASDESQYFAVPIPFNTGRTVSVRIVDPTGSESL